MESQKKVLLLSPSFYGYYELIEKEMRKKGYKVDTITYPGSILNRLAFYIKALACIAKRITSRKYQQVLNKVSITKYEFVVIIKGSVLPLEFLEGLKQTQTAAKFVLYIWDDIDLDSEEIPRFKFFDKVLSYSKDDSQKYNLLFRPMFFVEDLCQIQEKDIDLFYIGSYRNNRFDFIQRVISQLDLNNYKVILRCSPLLAFSRTKNLKKIEWFRFRNLKYEKMVGILNKSRVCVELCRPGQKSLSTRPFEAIGANCKLITTNREIQKYDFYNENNVCVVDENNPQIDIDWIHSPFISIPNDILEKYSIGSFVNDLLS